MTSRDLHRRKRDTVLTAVFITVFVLITATGCGGKADKAPERKVKPVIEAPTPEHPLPDTLRVATLYSPTSYFLYRETPMGYDYSLITSLTTEKGIALDLTIAASLADAVQMLDSGLVDIIAYEVPVTSEYREKALPCGPRNSTSQVLVQPAKGKKPIIRDVTQLVGRDVYVESNSKYQQRIENLDKELGGGIKIHPVDRDTLITEQLIEMVSSGEIPLTVVDSDIARINKTYYPDLDVSLEVGFPQRSAWAVSHRNKWLADSIDAWICTDRPRQENDTLLKRYFELSKILPDIGKYNIDFRKGRISPYDDLFRKYTRSTDIDWRLMAAIGYVESNYDASAVSWAGARGIMQIMPATARGYDVDPDSLSDPDISIRLAVRIFGELDKSLRSKVKDPKERIKFILAAYNGGIGHINDAIALARKTDRDPQVWFGSVEEALALKSKPEYYNDPVCRNGYFRSRQTTDYVHSVLDLYDNCVKHIKK